MAGLDWQTQTSGLKLREDSFCWQGAFDGDKHFFVRRPKCKPRELSDLLFGELYDDQVEHLLAEFITATGGLDDETLVFTAISGREDDHEKTVAVFDRTAKVGKNVAALLGRLTKNSLLNEDGNKWNAVLQLHPKELR